MGSPTIMAVTAAMLQEAETAYHLLLMGQGVASFRDQNGETVTYSRTDIAALRAYIEQMKRDLSGTPRSTGPMRVWL